MDAKMVDIFEWDHEEATAPRENGKKKSLEMMVHSSGISWSRIKKSKMQYFIPIRQIGIINL